MSALSAKDMELLYSATLMMRGDPEFYFDGGLWNRATRDQQEQLKRWCDEAGITLQNKVGVDFMNPSDDEGGDDGDEAYGYQLMPPMRPPSDN